MENTGAGMERRRFKRVKVKMRVLFRKDVLQEAKLSSGPSVFEGMMLDFGEGGLSILTNVDVPLSTVLRLKFTLGKIENEYVNFYGAIEVSAEVRNKVKIGQEYRLGLAFKDIDEKGKRQIMDFLNILESCLQAREQEK